MPSRAGEPWSDKEVSNLKRAVRAVSDRVEKQDRWRQIATLVGSGRSKRECYDKYKALKAEKAELREAEAKGGRRAEAPRRGPPPADRAPPQAAPKRAQTDASTSSTSSSSARRAPAAPRAVRTGGRRPRDLEAALVEAVSRIIWRASTGGRAKVCAVEGKPFVDRSSTYAPDGLTEHVRVWDAESLDDVRSLVAYYARDLAQPRGAGVLSVLYSALLSRTLRGARDDMDEVAGERRFLVDRHGYASQEAVNLLLVGKAVTNVFDGERRLEDDVAGTSDAVVLRGIPSKCDLGFLTLHEAYGYYTVGAHLKAPRSPCWVVYSESHYSVLFAPAGVDGATFDLFYWDGLAGQDERIKLTVTRDHYDHVRKPPDPNDDRALIPPLDLVVRSKWPNAAVDWNDTEPIL
ncbi:DUF4205-containing protein [Aureococcus anophagefferens]|nr:DUF4205-containing protein [Aureococcus anophagefferens]